MIQPRTVAAAAAVASLLLAGCSGGDTTDDASETPSVATQEAASDPTATEAPTETGPDPSATGEPVFTYGDADLAFLQRMAPSHDQAIAIAQLVTERTEREDFRVLASDTIAFREEQLATLVELAEDADTPVDPADRAAAGDAPSVVPDDEIAALEPLEGDAFDIAAAELLARIDEGAVTVADETLEGAEHPEIVVAAIDAIDRVEPEAQTLRTWIADWSG